MRERSFSLSTTIQLKPKIRALLGHKTQKLEQKPALNLFCKYLSINGVGPTGFEPATS